MKQSPSSEANNHSASQEIPHLLRCPKFHYRVHKSPSLVPILSQMKPVHKFPPYFLRCILILSSHLRLYLPVSYAGDPTYHFGALFTVEIEFKPNV
jgi:hypothetical protein